MASATAGRPRRSTRWAITLPGPRRDRPTGAVGMKGQDDANIKNEGRATLAEFLKAMRASKKAMPKAVKVGYHDQTAPSRAGLSTATRGRTCPSARRSVVGWLPSRPPVRRCGPNSPSAPRGRCLTDACSAGASPGGPTSLPIRRADRPKHGAVVPDVRLRDVWSRLDSRLPAQAFDHTRRQLTDPEGETPAIRHRVAHCRRIVGATVGPHIGGGVIRRARAQGMDFQVPATVSGWPPARSSSSTIRGSDGRAWCREIPSIPGVGPSTTRRSGCEAIRYPEHLPGVGQSCPIPRETGSPGGCGSTPSAQAAPGAGGMRDPPQP